MSLSPNLSKGFIYIYCGILLWNFIVFRQSEVNESRMGVKNTFPNVDHPILVSLPRGGEHPRTSAWVYGPFMQIG